MGDDGSRVTVNSSRARAVREVSRGRGRGRMGQRKGSLRRQGSGRAAGGDAAGRQSHGAWGGVAVEVGDVEAVNAFLIAARVCQGRAGAAGGC